MMDRIIFYGFMATLHLGPWLIIFLMLRTFAAARAIVQRWAEVNGYYLVEKEWAPFLNGPFTLTTTRRQLVYAVKVIDDQGRLCEGWVRFSPQRVTANPHSLPLIEVAWRG